jgi:hypothetical protein
MVTSLTTSCGSIERVHSWNGLDASAFSTGTAGSDARTGTFAPFMVTECAAPPAGDAADDDDDDAMAAARVRALRERRAAPLSMRERKIPVAPTNRNSFFFSSRSPCGAQETWGGSVRSCSLSCGCGRWLGGATALWKSDFVSVARMREALVAFVLVLSAAAQQQQRRPQLVGDPPVHPPPGVVDRLRRDANAGSRGA